jgi:hypothetical protein
LHRAPRAEPRDGAGNDEHRPQASAATRHQLTNVKDAINAIIRCLGQQRISDLYEIRRFARIRGFLPNGLAIEAAGTIYTDTHEGNGWATDTAIVAIKPNHRVSVLWTP